MHKLNFIALLIVTLLFALPVFSQNNQSGQMADTMRSNGKIYVVIAVILTILGGLIAYVVSLDKKISKMEKDNK
ncbi:MAG: CcmD family protein [Sphingobacteriales bacterium]|jgi:membrane protease YdiL (CAAX protease family)